MPAARSTGRSPHGRAPRCLGSKYGGDDSFRDTIAAETTIVLYGQEPVDFKYENPTDDSRHAKSSTR
jgi:hypothetical protein